jgi:hypothetical protein
MFDHVRRRSKAMTKDAVGAHRAVPAALCAVIGGTHADMPAGNARSRRRVSA